LFRNTWKILKCGAGEGWRISIGPIVRNGLVLYTVKERSTVPEVKRRKDHWIGHTLLKNCLINHVIERKIEGTLSRL
jgi:hypothetical protein